MFLSVYESASFTGLMAQKSEPLCKQTNPQSSLNILSLLNVKIFYVLIRKYFVPHFSSATKHVERLCQVHICRCMDSVILYQTMCSFPLVTFII